MSHGPYRFDPREPAFPQVAPQQPGYALAQQQPPPGYGAPPPYGAPPSGYGAPPGWGSPPGHAYPQQQGVPQLWPGYYAAGTHYQPGYAAAPRDVNGDSRGGEAWRSGAPPPPPRYDDHRGPPRGASPPRYGGGDGREPERGLWPPSERDRDSHQPPPPQWHGGAAAHGERRRSRSRSRDRGSVRQVQGGSEGGPQQQRHSGGVEGRGSQAPWSAGTALHSQLTLPQKAGMRMAFISGKDGRAPTTAAVLAEFLQLYAPVLDAMMDAAACARAAKLLVRGGGDADAARLIVAAHSAAWLLRPKTERGRDAQGAANVLYAAAKVRVGDASLQRALLLEAVRLAPEFNAQNAANAYWAAATLGERDGGIVVPLGRACVSLAGSFNAQNAANSLWAAAVHGVTDPSLLVPFAAAAEREFAGRMPAISAAQQLAQAHHAVRAAVHGYRLLSDALLERCHCVLEASPERPAVSGGQRDLAAALSCLGYAPQLEVPVLRGLHSVDILLQGHPLSEGVRVAVEFDGLGHFVGGAQHRDTTTTAAALLPNGETRLRDTILRGAGYVVVAVPFFEWDPLRGGEQDEYLRRRIATALQQPLAAPAPLAAAAAAPAAPPPDVPALLRAIAARRALLALPPGRGAAVT